MGLYYVTLKMLFFRPSALCIESVTVVKKVIKIKVLLKHILYAKIFYKFRKDSRLEYNCEIFSMLKIIILIVVRILKPN